MTRDKALGYLALAAKAGALRVGEQDIDKSVQRRKGRLLVLALDAGRNTLARAERLAAEQPMALVKTAYTKEEIAAAIGSRNPVALVLVRDEGLAGAFAKAAKRIEEQEEQT